jgi:hypothetical protein
MQAFNLCTVRLFDLLYDAFPRPIDLNPRMLAMVDGPEPTSDAERQQLFDDIEIPRHAVDWLETEGFVRVRHRMLHGELVGVVLSQKGLAALNGVPASVLQKREPLFRRFKEALTEKAPGIAVEKAGDAMAALVSAGASGLFG